MEAFFSWVGAALGALFVVAVLVAWWEHLVRSNRRPATAPASPPVRAVTVDVPLDALTAPPPGDTAERQAALDATLQRMASAAAVPASAADTETGSDSEPSTWIATEPMVLSPAPETERPARSLSSS